MNYDGNILVVTDHGDLSVGIFPSEFYVHVPFDIKCEKDLREDFKKDILSVYKQYSDGRLTANYLDEII